MPNKNWKSVEPVSLADAAAHFHPRDWKDYAAEVEQEFDRRSPYRGTDRDPALESKRLVAIRDTAIEIAHKESIEALWIDIQKGKLILAGFPDRGDVGLRVIPNHVLDDPDRSLNFPKGKVCGSGVCFANVRVLTASEAKNVPEFCGANEKQSERPEPQKVAKGTPGAKPKWNWTGANQEMMGLANSSDCLPHPQAAVERHIMNWFVDHYDDSPAESEIRKFVVDRLPENYRDIE